MFTLKTKGACGKAENRHLASLVSVSQVYCELRDRSGEGQSTWHDGRVFDKAGGRPHRVSYNGKVWDMAGKLVYNPYEVKP